MKIFGTDYATPDGTCVRDYIHVSDIARAHICGLEKFEHGLNAAEVNIGTGHGYSNLQILKMVESVTGLPMPYETTPRRPGDLSQLYADATKAQSVLAFQPEHSDLKNIIETAWNFYKQKNAVE